MSETDLINVATAVVGTIVLLIVLAFLLRRPRYKRREMRPASAKRPELDKLRAEHAIAIRQLEARVEALNETLRRARIENARLRYAQPGAAIAMPAIPMPAPDMPSPQGAAQTAPADPDAAGAALAAAEARIAALLAELSAAKSAAAAVPKTPDADDRRESLARLALRESAVSARESALAQREQEAAATWTESETAARETAAREAALAERVAALESENAALKQAPAAVTVEPAKAEPTSEQPPAPTPARLEDVEAALLRQRLSDIAAEVAAMTAAVEGSGGPIDELLAKDAADLAAPGSAPSLAEKIRRLRQRTAPESKAS